MKRRFRNSIAFRLSLYVSLVALLVVALFLASAVFYSYRLQVNGIEQKAQDLESLQLPQLTNRVWDFADLEVEEQVRALHALQHVTFVELTAEAVDFKVGVAQDDDVITKRFILDHPYGGEIGQLTIQFSLESVRSTVLLEMRTVLGFVLIPFLVMAVAILLVFRQLVTKPLDDLAEYARHLTMDTLDQAFHRRRRETRSEDELDHLHDAIDAMRTNLSREIAQRQSTERKLSEVEQRYQQVFNATADGIFIHDAETGGILEVNQTMLDMYGLTSEEAKKADVDDLSAGPSVQQSDDAFRLIRLAAAGEPQLFEWCAKRSNGEAFWVEVSLKSMAPMVEGQVLAVVRDITARKAAEEELRQYQKMDSIGQLAGGIAHDFNNILMGVLGSAELISLQTEDPEVKELVGIIVGTANRAADLTSKLLTFSRKGMVIAGTVDMHEICQDAATILEHAIDKRITLKLEFSARRHATVGDRSQLQSAVLNLGLNARDAMPDGGTLTVATSDVDLDAQFCSNSPFDLEPGPFLLVSVIDTGIGMDRQTREKVFEPFYTTKEVGKGTGLGLSAVYGTIAEHRGAVALQSELGQGTSVHLYLPVTTTDSSEDHQEPDVVEGSECILVIDDEEVVRDTMGVILKKLGYRILLAGDGEEGVDVFRQRKDEIDLVILDMIMPRMSGQEAFRCLRQIDPEARVLVSSGFAQDDSVGEMLREGCLGFLRKPFRRAELSQTVAQALGH